MKYPKLKNNLSVLIPDGESLLAHYVIICLAEIPEIKISILSNIKFAACKFSRHVSNYFYLQSQNKKERTEQILKTADDLEADIILPVDEPVIELLSKSKDKFTGKYNHTLLPSYESFNICINKNIFAAFLEDNNLPTPKTLYSKYKDPRIEFSNIVFPVLAKPINGFNGIGIEKIENRESLNIFLDKIDNPHQYIYQSFIEGYDIDCSVLCKRGELLAYTIQKGFYKRGKGFNPPMGIEFIAEEEILSTASKLVKTLNYSGIAHIDFRYDKMNNQFKILELNPRYWGSLLGSLKAGINFPFLSCLCSLGFEIPANKYDLIKFIPMQRAAVLWKENFKHSGKFSFSLKNTNYKYLMNDPLPEIISRYRVLKK